MLSMANIGSSDFRGASVFLTLSENSIHAMTALRLAGNFSPPQATIQAYFSRTKPRDSNCLAQPSTASASTNGSDRPSGSLALQASV